MCKKNTLIRFLKNIFLEEIILYRTFYFKINFIQVLEENYYCAKRFNLRGYQVTS